MASCKSCAYQKKCLESGRQYPCREYKKTESKLKAALEYAAIVIALNVVIFGGILYWMQQPAEYAGYQFREGYRNVSIVMEEN